MSKRGRTVLVVSAAAVLLALVVIAVGVMVDRRAVGDPPVLPATLGQLDPEIRQLIVTTTGEVTAQPRVARGWMKLALLYQSNEYLTQAAWCYEQALRLNRKVPQCWYHLALIRAESGESERGIEAMGRVVALRPEYAPAHWRLGYWHLEAQRLDEAERWFTSTLGVETNNTAARFGLARVHLLRGTPEAAIELLEGLAAEEPRHADYANLLLADAYRRAGRMDHLVGLELAAEPQRPVWTDPWAEEGRYYQRAFGSRLDRAIALLNGGRASDAIAPLQALHQLRPEDVTVLVNLAVAHLKVNQVDEASELLQGGLERHADHFAVHLNLASALSRQGDRDRALVHARQACELNPNLAQAHETRGAVLLAMGSASDAVAALEEAVRLEPKNGLRHLNLGKAQLKAQRKEHAQASFHQAVELDPRLSAIVRELMDE